MRSRITAALAFMKSIEARYQIRDEGKTVFKQAQGELEAALAMPPVPEKVVIKVEQAADVLAELVVAGLNVTLTELAERMDSIETATIGILAPIASVSGQVVALSENVVVQTSYVNTMSAGIEDHLLVLIDQTAPAPAA